MGDSRLEFVSPPVSLSGPSLPASSTPATPEDQVWVAPEKWPQYTRRWRLQHALWQLLWMGVCAVLAALPAWLWAYKTVLEIRGIQP